MIQNDSESITEMPVVLEGLSMSAEYLDSLGLIICGFNPQSKQTEVQKYDTKTCKWNTISTETL
jgi:hypothetical protein